MVFVSRKKGESKESMFRKFTRSFIDEEIVDDVRNKLFYKKPSLQRKEKEKELLKARKKFRSPRRDSRNSRNTRNTRNSRSSRR